MYYLLYIFVSCETKINKAYYDKYKQEKKNIYYQINKNKKYILLKVLYIYILYKIM